MNILDIHTHRFYNEPSESILNCFPEDFVPFPDRYYSVGFHPWYVAANPQPDWDKFQEQVSLPQVLAIGEAGLDKLSVADMSVQEEFFIKQAKIASRLNKPLIIHCVHAWNEIIRHKINLKPGNPWIIHGFRGKKDLAAQLLQHDFYLSFGEKFQESALFSTPIGRLFFETDESAVDIRELYQKASGILSLPPGDLTEMVQQNICNVFFR